MIETIAVIVLSLALLISSALLWHEGQQHEATRVRLESYLLDDDEDAARFAWLCTPDTEVERLRHGVVRYRIRVTVNGAPHQYEHPDLRTAMRGAVAIGKALKEIAETSA